MVDGYTGAIYATSSLSVTSPLLLIYVVPCLRHPHILYLYIMLKVTLVTLKLSPLFLSLFHTDIINEICGTYQAP